MKIYWTYSRKNLKPSDVHKHEKAAVRLSNDKYHIGGLNRPPIFTHCICPKGYLHSLGPYVRRNPYSCYWRLR